MQLGVVGALCLGVVVVSSAGMGVGEGAASVGGMLFRQTVYAGIALLAMVWGSHVDVRAVLRVRGVWCPVYWLVGGAVLLLVAALVPGLGREVNGASRWLYLGPQSWGLSFQPSEVAKWVMVLAAAYWCARRQGALGRTWDGFAPMSVLVAVVCGLIVVEDLGTAVLIGMVWGCVVVAGGARWWQMAVTGLGAAGGVVWMIVQSPYRVARLTAFMDPWADPMGRGYHPIQSLIAIAGGGWAGRGLGSGVRKFGYLPEDTTDFVFAVICEEMGMAGAVLVVTIYGVLIWGGMAILRRCPDAFGKLFALGVLLTLGLQAVVNLAVVTVLVPTKGIALPLISAGGTGWVLTALCVGLVCGLDRPPRGAVSAQSAQ